MNDIYPVPQPDFAPSPVGREQQTTPTGWPALRRFTDARIALGRAGHSLPTGAHLAFQLAHAQARDAVHVPFDALGIADSLQAQGLQTLLLHSAAANRAAYLQRPDLGRQLDARARETLAQWRSTLAAGTRFNLAFVVADGLSPLAMHHHTADLVAATRARLQADAQQRWALAPVAIVARRPRPQFARQPGHLHYLGTPARPDRRQPQLHFQRASSGPFYRRSSGQTASTIDPITPAPAKWCGPKRRGRRYGLAFAAARSGQLPDCLVTIKTVAA